MPSTRATSSAPEEFPPRGGRAFRMGAALGFAVAIAALALVLAHRPDWLPASIERARTLGPAGGAAYGLLYVVVALAMLPVSPLTIDAGYAFGPVAGVLVAAPASCVAACFHMVLLLRLSPLVPFPILNYALGLTPLRLRDFAAASFLGMFPATAAYAWLGSLLPSARDAAAGGRLGGTARWAILASLALLTVLVTAVAHRALRRALAQVSCDVPRGEGRPVAPPPPR